MKLHNQAMRISYLIGDAVHEKNETTEPIPKYYEEKYTGLTVEVCIIAEKLLLFSI